MKCFDAQKLTNLKYLSWKSVKISEGKKGNTKIRLAYTLWEKSKGIFLRVKATLPIQRKIEHCID